MNRRYFKLTGDSLKAYLESESKEFAQRKRRTEVILGYPGVQGYRPSHNGVRAIIFKPGEQPEGMVRASKLLTVNEVRPHKSSKIAKPIRDLIASIRVTEDCQKLIRTRLNLPTCVYRGRELHQTAIGHVGEVVFVSVPVREPNSDNPQPPFEGHTDLVEVKKWEFVKACEEHIDHKSSGYSLVEQGSNG